MPAMSIGITKGVVITPCNKVSMTVHTYRKMLRYFCRYSGYGKSGEMKEKVRVEIRMPKTLKERLELEAKCCEESMNAYLLMIIGHRKRVRVNLRTEGGHYLGF
jgi:hypothetical protein